MRLSIVSLLAVASLGSACGKKSPTPGPATTPAATTPAAPTPTAAAAPDAAVASAPDAAAATTPAAEDAATPETTEAAAPEVAVAPVVNEKVAALEAKAKELVTAWVAAQNQGNFDAYAAFYAPRFTGIKRSGPRERKFAQAGWLADRRNMFKSAMQVTADEVAVSVSSDTAVVTFVQTWASGTYQDKGQKQLVLVPSKDGLEIAREEMLQSQIEAAGSEPKALDLGVFSFVIKVEGDLDVVIPAEHVDLDWASGAPKLVKKQGPTTVIQAVDVEKLPAEFKAWLGRKVTTEAGCTGSIDRLELVGRYVPHFGTVQTWNGTDGVDAVGKALSDEAIAREALDGGSIDVELVGHIAGCSDGLWVREEGKPAPVVYAKDAADPKLEKALLSEYRKLAGWKAIAAEAKQAEPPVTTPTWDVFEGAAPSVTTWTDATSGRTFAQVVGQAGSGCGQFGGAFGALFEVKNKGAKATFVLLTDAEGGPTAAIEAVVDLDGDGDVEFVIDEGLIQRAGPVWTRTFDLTPPDFDCPC